ncbi:tripartite tricarboxylate transporter TctB family protein [Hoeflea poritis]|uniref:Tripartite tricarboxylate transporter TctB family protein n=1 Tax=Hoeflea poritis TaxID=2993659 RepID=A0ABT4VWI0_9HYPH|nr:tripartite tricarboxylate transporter TctB family protein [Hoeflea poritis]MDA4848363.1 tripartite tricarboxylate transporter TctB family protein [Hoeflea poritis]
MRALDLTISAVFFATSILFLVLTYSSDFDVPTFGGDVGPAFAPRGYLIIAIVLSAIVFFNAMRSEDTGPVGQHIGRMVLVSSIGAVTGLAMLYVGFVFAAIPGFFCFCYAFGYRRIAILLVLSIAAPLLIWWIFTFGFELWLPRSPWFGRL